MADDPTVKTIDPTNPTGPRIDAVVPGWWARKLYKTSPVRYLNLVAAKFVLENTERILHGVRKFTQGGWCYTGRPESWYIKIDVKASFPGNKVFAVYLNPDMTVYECRAEYAAPDDPVLPVDWNNPERYKGLLWKNTSKTTS